MRHYIDNKATVGENIAAAVAEQRRLFEVAHPVRTAQPPIPDVPAERYDVCACGMARFMHNGHTMTFLGFQCDGPFVLAQKLVLRPGQDT